MSLDAIHDNYLQDLFDYFLEQGYSHEDALEMVHKTIAEQNK